MDIISKILKKEEEENPLFEQVYRDLAKDILTGTIKPGSRLVESRLCEKYSISRTPLREAFRMLETDGLALHIPNRGEIARGLTDQEIHDLLFIMGDLETRASSWAAERITDEELEDLSHVFRYMEFYTMKNDVPKMIDINTAFHRMIYMATHNEKAEKRLISYQTYARYSSPPNYFAKNVLKRVLEEHRLVYSAVMAKDPSLAMRYMKSHMNKTIDRCLSNH